MSYTSNSEPSTQDHMQRWIYTDLSLSLVLYVDIMQVDIPVKYLGFFLEDDEELEHIKRVI